MADGNVLDQFDDAKNLAAGQSVLATSGTDPEIAARAQRAAAALGIPQSALTSVKDAETRVQVQQANAALPAAPKTAGWLVDRNNAAVTAPHEVSGLARLEQLAGAALIPLNPLAGGLTALDAFNQSYNQGAQPGDLARAAVSHAASAAGSIARGFGSAMDAITRLQEGPEERAFEAEIGDHGPMPSDSTAVVAKPLIAAGQATAPQVQTPITNAVGAAAGFVPVVGAALLNPALGVVAGASQGADQIAQDAQAKGQDGSEKADIATLADAGLQGALTLVGIKAPGMGVILPKIAGPAMSTLVKLGLAGAENSAARVATEVATDRVLRLGVATAENAATGGLMQGGSNLIEKSSIDPQKDLGEGVGDSAAQMALFGGLFHSAHMLPGALKEFSDTVTARMAANANATMVAAMREAEVSPVAARAPGRFADLMSQIAPGQNAYVPADVVREFLQAKMSPEEQTQFADAAGISDQLPTAVGPGADIAFPVDKLLAVVARTPGATDAFADHLRLAPDGMSDAEGRNFDQHYANFIQERGDQLATEGAIVNAAMAPAHAVYSDAFSQAREAGYTIDAAEQHAALWASHYEARAALMGTDALSEFQRAGEGRGVAIRRELPPELVSRFDRLDPVIDALRKGSKARDTEGPSLLDYLSRNGGLKDEGGELSAMDAQTWHTAKPFRSRLVRPDGKSLEQAAEGAQEAGYLGAGHEDHIGQQADPAALLEAVRRELAGERITARPLDQRAADFQRAVDGLDETLGRLGIDPETSTNAEIKDAVRRYQAERGRTLNQFAGVKSESAPRDLRTFDQEKRGSISFGDGPAIIRLFQGRDLSTLAHETGHLWAEELRADAARSDAPEQVKADWATAAKWLGADPDAALTTEQHEQFARGFEAYLMEGHAPSEALRSVFQKFRSWLVNIYRNISALNVHVSPEMKAVFDRLVATEDEIHAAAKRESLNPIFLSPEDGNMSTAEWSAYTHALTASNEAARDQLMVKLMRDIRRTRTKEWRDERAALREDEAKQTDARPDVRAYHYLTRGELLGADEQPPARKLDRNAVVMTFGTDAVLDRLPRGSTVEAGGVQPDEIADLTGHASGEAMLERVMALEDARKAQRVPPRGVRKMLTDSATNEEMISRHGDALHDGSIEEEAADALHNDARMLQVSLEVAALGKVNEERPWTREIFKRFAADEIAKKRIGDLRPDAFLRAERQAGNEAQRALLAGDAVKALERKRQQLLNMYFYRASRDARDLARRQLGAFDRFAKAKQIATIAQPYLDQIHALLQRYGYRVPLANLAATAELEKWRDEEEKAGASIYDSSPPNPRAMKDLSVTELDGLHDIVQNIAHLGRRDKELFVNGRREAKDALIDQAIVEAHGVKDMVQPGTFQGQSDRARGKSRWPRAYDAWQTKVESIVDRLGGGPRSVLNQVLIDAASDAGVVKNGLLREVSDGLHKDYSALPREVRMSWSRKVDAPELADPLRPGQAADLTHGQVVGILFNWGSASSKTKLLDGYNWDEGAVKAVMDRVLTKADYDFAQGVWGRLQSLWPHIVKTEMELGGLAPEKVDPLPFSTPHGDYAGGYFPAHYDQELVARPINSWQDLFNRTFRQATTQKGHTISRTDFTGPIMLSPEGYLFNHVNNVITRISHGRFIRDANNFLRDPRIKRLISDKVGPEYYKQFDGWLQGQAGVNMTDPSALSSMDKFLRARRSNFIIATSAINPTVIFEHAGAFASSAQVIGEKALADGVARYAANPVAAAEFVFSRSPEFKDRIYAPTRDLKDLQDQLRASHDGAFSMIERKTGLPVSDLDRAGHKVQELAHLPITYVNAYVVGMPTWLGAFHDALGKDHSEADAIRIANKAVRVSHGSGNAMDLSSAQRGPELMKLATMFYSWRSTQYQLQRASIWNTLHAQSPKQVGEGLRQGIYAFAITPLSAALVAGAAPALWPIIKAAATGQPMPEGLGDQWREWIADELLRNLWSGTVGVRDLANAALNKVEGKPGGYEMSPLERLPASMIQASHDSEVIAAHAAGFQEESQVSKNAARNMVDAISEYQGIPIAPQAVRGAAYAHGVATGEQTPNDPLDYANGLLHGAQARH